MRKWLKFVSFVIRFAIWLIRGEGVGRCFHECHEVLLCSVSIVFHHKSAISVILDGRVAVNALFVAQIWKKNYTILMKFFIAHTSPVSNESFLVPSTLKSGKLDSSVPKTPSDLILFVAWRFLLISREWERVGVSR